MNSQTTTAATFWAKYVKEARTHLNMTQQELATLWGKSQEAVSDIELDIRSIVRSDIPSLARALGLPVSELLEASGFMAADSGDIVLKPGRRVVLVTQEGESGRVIDLDESMLAALNLLAKKRARLQRAKTQGASVHKPREKSI